MKKQQIAAAMAVFTVASSIMPLAVQASTSFDMRKKVVGISGIMGVTSVDLMVTRREFASMLVNASSYRSTVSGTSKTSVFADVAKESLYAPQIRIAAEQGWMSGYLGGNFKPDEYITLQDAIKGMLALLGYTNSDFTGDQSGARLSKYYYLNLDEYVNKKADEVLTKEDCIHLFYNLLKADMVNGKMFGTSLGCELTSDGEINPLTMIDYSLKGPKVVKSRSSLSNYLPFSMDLANIYLDGTSSNETKVKTLLDNGQYLLIYYHPLSKTVWAYTIGQEEENQGRYAVTGEITNIIYQSSDLMIPSAVILDNGVEYTLSSSEMQFAFSTYGDLNVGDEITLVYTMSSTSSSGESENQVRKVIDYIE